MWLDRLIPALRRNRVNIKRAALAKQRSRLDREIATGALRSSLRKVLRETCDPAIVLRSAR